MFGSRRLSLGFGGGGAAAAPPTPVEIIHRATDVDPGADPDRTVNISAGATGDYLLFVGGQHGSVSSPTDLWVLNSVTNASSIVELINERNAQFENVAIWKMTITSPSASTVVDLTQVGTHFRSTAVFFEIINGDMANATAYALLNDTQTTDVAMLQNEGVAGMGLGQGSITPPNDDMGTKPRGVNEPFENIEVALQHVESDFWVQMGSTGDTSSLAAATYQCQNDNSGQNGGRAVGAFVVIPTL